MPAAGDLVGKWKLERPLGEGASATVWLAHLRTDPGVQVAVKLIRPADLATYVDRLAREAELLRRLDHPSIVKHRGSGSLVNEGLFFLVMDKVDGEDLFRRLAGGPLSSDATRRLFRDLASALRYAHGRGVFHRDLKPSNVIVRPDGGGCVIDFGIALQVGLARLTAEGMVPGTVAYMPPELFVPGAQPDPGLGDVYALGLMLYEALSGERAFEPRSDLPDTQAVMLLIQQKGEAGAFDPGPQVPQDLRNLVQLATEPNPDLRIASMERFAERLGATPLPPARGRSPLATATGTRWLDDDETPAADDGGWRPGLVEPQPPSSGGRPGAARSADVSPPARSVAVGAPSKPSSGTSEVRATPPPPPMFDRKAARPATVPAVQQRPAQDALVPHEDDERDDEESPAVVGPVARAGAPVLPTPDDVARPPQPEAPQRSYLPLIVGAALLAGSTLLLAVGAVMWVLWKPGEATTKAETPPVEVSISTAPRQVELSLAADLAIWLDGSRVSTTGLTTLLTLTPGPHPYQVGLGSDCGALPEPGPCCAVREGVLELPAGETAFPWTPEPPAPQARALQVTIAGPGASLAQVWIDDQVVPVADGVAQAELLPGPHIWRVEAGTCQEKARGCAAGGSCPPGCVSHVQSIEMVCGSGAQRVLLDVPEPIGTASTTPPPIPPTKDKPPPGKDPRQPRPSNDPTTPAPVEQRLVVDVTVNARTVDKAGPETQVVQAGVAAQSGSLKACFERFIGGKPSEARTVTVEFKTDRAGVVDSGSVRVVGSSGISQIDACATSAVKSAKFAGTKKAGAGKVAVRFEANRM